MSGILDAIDICVNEAGVLAFAPIDDAEAPALEADPLRLYTLSEAASHLGVRDDDLIALLPDVSLGAAEQSRAGFSPAEIELLERLVVNIRKFYAESVYGGIDLGA